MTDIVKEENKVTQSTKSSEAGKEQKFQNYHRPNLDFVFDNNNSADPLDSVVEIEELDINRTINIASLGPGSILKNTREQANLTKDDVAKELRLPSRQIEYLEQDAYHKFTAVAFYVGYVRNYSRLLNLDPDKMIAKFYAVYKVKPEVAVQPTGSADSIRSYKKFTNLWPLNLFFDENKSYQERSKNIKVFLAALASVAAFLVIWWMISGSNNQSLLVQNDVNSIESMAPHKVDEVLPTSPVIVNNTVTSKKDQAEAGTVVNKKNMLDRFS